MVFVVVSKFGKTNLIFVDPGVKINGTYCRAMLLTGQLLPVMCEISGEFFIFQQDNAPAHCSLRDIQPSRMGDICFHFTRQSCGFQQSTLSTIDYRSW